MSKGHENLRPQNTRTKEEQREVARMGGKASAAARKRTAELRAAFGVEPLTKEKMKEADAVLLAMNEEQLRKVAEDKHEAVYLRRRARVLMSQSDEKSVNIAECMLDRAFGKPRQEIEADLTTNGPVWLMDNHLKKDE